MSNLGDLLKDVTDSNSEAVGLIGDVLGAAADISGALGLVTGIIGLFGGGDPTQAAMSNILTTIQHDFAQLHADDKAGRILDRLRNLDNITGPPQGQLQQLQAHMTTDIGLCLIAIDELALNADAVSNWEAVFGDQIFWTDSGEYFQIASSGLAGLPPVFWMDAGYGEQTPPQVGADLVFSYLYVLPDFLRTLSIFIAVAGSDDPNWVADYKTQVLKPVAAFLKTNVHDTIVGGITQLSPGYWDGQTLANNLTPGFPGRHPWPGVSQIPLVTSEPFPFGPQPPFPTGANIEFGAVENYSGYSSMGNYQISFQDIPSTDPSPFNKFQIRLLKRAIDVYIGVGLLQVWKVINSLNALAGAPPIPTSPYAGWSFRQILRVSKFQADPTTKKYSLYGLAQFIKYTLPLDTMQRTFFTSFQELLNH